jgi:hypothetical protein
MLIAATKEWKSFGQSVYQLMVYYRPQQYILGVVLICILRETVKMSYIFLKN